MRLFTFRSWRALLVALALVGLALCSDSARAQIIVSDSNVGYIDTAVLATQMRLRFDAAYHSRFADRVEFVYAKYEGPGAPLKERGIDNHQQLSAYLEYQACENFSLFVEVPFRWIDPIVNDNTGSLYDITAGGKAALLTTENCILTGQLRTYIPTGDANSGLGTDHVSLEPALLYLNRVSPKLTFESELRNWIPIDATVLGGGATPRRDFSANVLRYGAGFGYRAYDGPSLTATPVAEVVGWHVFGGLKSRSDGARISALNDAITNIKVGLRFGMNRGGPNCQPRDNLYVGYGRAMTDAIWYRDIVRLEWRRTF